MNNPTNNRTFAVVAMICGIALILFVTISLVNTRRQQQLASTPSNLNAAEPTDNGNDVVIVENELVADFPEFPVYPGARLVESSQTSYFEKEGFGAKWEIRASVPVVMKYYYDLAQKNNWTVVEYPSRSDSTQEQNISLSVNGRPVNINVEMEQDGATEIVVDFLPQ